eukprot:scaffold1838_cov381-Prasinococcus_capsulatus_cf.AAC.3
MAPLCRCAAVPAWLTELAPLGGAALPCDLPRRSPRMKRTASVPVTRIATAFAGAGLPRCAGSALSSSCRLGHGVVGARTRLALSPILRFWAQRTQERHASARGRAAAQLWEGARARTRPVYAGADPTRQFTIHRRLIHSQHHHQSSRSTEGLSRSVIAKPGAEGLVDTNLR